MPPKIRPLGKDHILKAKTTPVPMKRDGLVDMRITNSAIPLIQKTRRLMRENVDKYIPVARDFLWTSPYYGSRLSAGYMEAGGRPLKEARINTIDDVNAFKGKASLLVMGNFIKTRNKIRNAAIEAGMDVIHGEDGWFPHNKTMHADPLGFCWESSLPTMKYRPLNNEQQTIVEALKNKEFLRNDIEPFDHPRRYVFIPLQLHQDQVNVHGLKLDSFQHIVNHVAENLPLDFDIVVKHHPRTYGIDPRYYELAQKYERIKYVPMDANLQGIILNSAAVAAANSTVLYESRLIFDKPVICYADSWYTNHEKIFPRISLEGKGEEQFKPLFETDDAKEVGKYRDWFLFQLIMRQCHTDTPMMSPRGFLQWFDRRTFNSWKKYGEDIFYDMHGSGIFPT